MAIYLETEWQIGLLKPEYVIFASMGPKSGQLDSSQVLYSSYARNGWVYLLNPPPGTYVPAYILGRASFLLSGTRFQLLMRQDAALQMQLTVVPGRSVLAGAYRINGFKYPLNDPDPLQVSLQELTQIPLWQSVLMFALGHPAPAIRDAKLSENLAGLPTRDDFLKAAREYFAGTPWLSYVEQAAAYHNAAR